MATAAAALLAFTRTGQAQTTYYNSATTTANPQTGAEHFLEQLSFAGGGSNYTLTAFTLGVNYADATQDSVAVLQFYTGVDTSSTSANILATATSLGSVGGTLAAPGTNGNYTFTFTLNTPINFGNVSGLAVEVFLETADQASYATGILNGRFTASAPTIGSSTGFVYNDANLDSVFTGAEKTTFGLAQANIRLALTGNVTAAVPEPNTWAMVGVGLVGASALAARHRRRQQLTA